MKPSTATVLTVAVLLAAAMLCPVIVPRIAGEEAAVPGDDPLRARSSAPQRMDLQDSDPEAAQKAMNRRVQTQLLNANWMERSRNLLLLAEHLKPDEWPLAMNSLPTMGINRHGEEGILLMTAWTEVDPLAAVGYLKTLRHAVIPLWITRDPKAAWEWIMSQDQAEQPELVGFALLAWVKTDLPRVTRELAAMKDRGSILGYDRGSILGDVARRIAGMEKGASRQWLDSISDPKLKDEALHALLTNLPQSRIEEKLELVHDQPEMRKRVTQNLYHAWADVDEAAAMASFENLEPGEEREIALLGIIQCLSPKDPVRALDIIDRHPGHGQDLLLCSWVTGVADDDPALGLGQIHRIERPDDLEMVYRRVLTTWLEKDGAAAREWLATHDLPPSLKQEFKPD
ncbi:hypothetical protein [Luteolibacter soli]|uniref:HEAT repeat domain-containing protein n=1 Tax=Luteolibacter soli TaxID=3135280 RepID=A0ABU9AS80_9BACT